MHSFLKEMLECPACHGRLLWKIGRQDGDQIEAGEAICSACAARYPIRDGIGLFLTPDLPRNDLWEQADSGLVQYLKEHPEIERQLLENPLESLSPADLFFRAMALEAQGEFAEAQQVEAISNQGLYTAEYLDCWASQTDYLLDWLAAGDGPIIDLASGRGYLVGQMARRLERPVVATDFSPLVLRRNRRWLQAVGLDERVSLLAFDARRTPFRDGAVETMTTNLGLPNIEEPGELLHELHRVVSGDLLSISHFYPEDDEVNGQALREAGLDLLLTRRSAVAQFVQAGWQVELLNVCRGAARPTPAGVLLEGAQVDGLPAAETTLEWCVLRAWDDRIRAVT